MKEETTNFEGAAIEEAVDETNDDLIIVDDWADTLVKEVYDAETNFLEAKRAYEHLHNELTLTTNWNTINEDRVEKGLSKISNESQRKAYLSMKCESAKRNKEDAEAYFRFCRNNFDILLAREKYE